MYSTRKKMSNGMRKGINWFFVIFVLLLFYFIYIAIEGHGCTWFPDLHRVVSTFSTTEKPPISKHFSANRKSKSQANLRVLIRYKTDERLFTVFSLLSLCGYGSNSNDLRADITEYLFQRVRDGLMPSYDQGMAYFKHKRIDVENLSNCQLRRFTRFALSLSSPPSFKVSKDISARLRLKGFDRILAKFYRESNINSLWLRYKNKFAGRARAYKSHINEALEPFFTCFAVSPSKRKISIIVNMLIQSKLYTVYFTGNSSIFVFGASYPKHSVETLRRIRRLYTLHYSTSLLNEQTKDIKKVKPILFKHIKNTAAVQKYCMDWMEIVQESFYEAAELHCRDIRNKRKYLDNKLKKGFILTYFFFDGFERYPNSNQNFMDFMKQWIKTLPKSVNDIIKDFNKVK